MNVKRVCGSKNDDEDCMFDVQWGMKFDDSMGDVSTNVVLQEATSSPPYTRRGTVLGHQPRRKQMKNRTGCRKTELEAV